MNTGASGPPREARFRAEEARFRARAAKPGQIMAALDLGTNNCRLLVARQAAAGFQVIDAFSRIVRLGEGVSQSGQLSAAAIDRTIEALKICAAKMQRRGVTLARAVATEACRRAVNGAGFVARARDEAGIGLDIITSGEEAELAFKGCMPLLDRQIQHAIVFDIGGGSTELGWLRIRPGEAPQIVAWHSVPLGVVSITEQFGIEPQSGQSYRDFYEAMVQLVQDHLEPFQRAIGARGAIAAGAVQMLGTSGTVTTLAGINLNLPRYDRALVDGCFIDFPAIDRISTDLALRDVAGRSEVPCVGVERADLVVSGCAILAAICRLWPVGRLRVADRGVREGILMSLMTGTAPDSVYAPGEDRRVEPA